MREKRSVKPEERTQFRSPDFESGVIAEPALAFGGRHEHVDPKVGLALYGPYTMQGQTKPSLSSVIVGIVGPAPMIANAVQWLEACKGIVKNSGSQPFLYPHFPGFNTNLPFQCELATADTWHETIKQDDLDRALSSASFAERVKKTVRLYDRCIEVLAQRDPRPDITLCCIPQDVIDLCTVRVKGPGEVKQIKISKAERIMKQRAEEASKRGQFFLFPELDPLLGVESDEWGYHNLRRGLKAEAMQFGIPTQLVWPGTLQLGGTPPAMRGRRVQDPATRAWNFTVALYHKAGGLPWRLAQVEPGVCYVGISFYRETAGGNPRMRTSMAQAFTSAGDGYVLRGNPFEWDETMQGKSPHLDQKSAMVLLQNVITLYRRQNRSSMPIRVVVHKTSKYTDEERRGFSDACQYVPRKDFVALSGRGIQFFRTGDYPPLRGTYVKFSDTNLLLYTDGYMPFLRTYPGPRVPQPLEILEHHGDSPWNVVLQDILSLTKMNWNTADFACSYPITLAFSQKVSQMLADLPPEVQPRSEYRFYM